MKNLMYLFVFLFLNSIYSQTPCGGGYTFTYGTYVTGGCDYWFLPTVPGSPTINHFTWRFNSSGTYRKNCGGIADTVGTVLATDTAKYLFCFSGNHDVAVTISFDNGTTCTIIITVNVTCSGAVVCDPDPARTDPIPDPTVEITYVSPETTCGVMNPAKSGCMSQSGGGHCGSGFCVACGWIWAIRIPVSSYNCELFTYKIEYVDVDFCDNGTTTCFQLTPGTTYCIKAKLNEDIKIVAYGNSCCIPDGYERAFIWTPTPVSMTPISAPTTTYGVCQPYRCPTSASCTEDQQTISQSSSIPTLSCFSGGKKTSTSISAKKELNLENNNFKILGPNANIEQNVIIYNTEGIEVFNGKWRFGDPNNLNWPDNFRSGLYFIKFQNAMGKELIKLYKFN